VSSRERAFESTNARRWDSRRGGVRVARFDARDRSRRANARGRGV